MLPLAGAALFLALMLHPAQPVDARALPLPAAKKPANAGAASTCSLSLTTGRGKTLTFSHCYAAEGGFSILWNHSSEGSDSLISFGVQKKWSGWTAFGTSPGGKLLWLPLAVRCAEPHLRSPCRAQRCSHDCALCRRRAAWPSVEPGSPPWTPPAVHIGCCVQSCVLRGRLGGVQVPVEKRVKRVGSVWEAPVMVLAHKGTWVYGGWANAFQECHTISMIPFPRFVASPFLELIPPSVASHCLFTPCSCLLPHHGDAMRAFIRWQGRCLRAVPSCPSTSEAA